MSDTSNFTFSRDHLNDLVTRLWGMLAARKIPVPISYPQTAIARIMGVERWCDLVGENGNAESPPISLDESLDVPLLTTRLCEQADVLKDALWLASADACAIAAELRATAHPDGPHKIIGDSSVVAELGRVE